MALMNSSDHRLSVSKRHLKPLMLRDYLLDDLSSCSSNGFKSFPRRQCCSTTVRFLVETELKRSRIPTAHQKRRLSRSRSTCGAAIGFAVQKASTALVNAVKRLPYSIKSPSTTVRSRAKQEVFYRSLSKRLLRRSFWRKPDHLYRRERDDGEIGRRTDFDDNHEGDRDREIQRWRSFADFLRESPDQPSNQITYLSAAAVEATDSTPVGGGGGGSVFVYSSSSGSENGGNSWDGSEFFTNSDVVQSSSSGESEISNENDAVEDETETLEGIKTGAVRIGAHDSDGSVINRSPRTEDNRKKRVNEEREQFSPVSILECPFDEEDNEISPPSHQNSALVKETNEKFTRKIRRFGGFARLEPVDLEKRIEQYTERQESIKTHYSNFTLEKASATSNAEEDEIEKQANYLLDLIKSKADKPNSLLMSNAIDNLLLDFFQEDTQKIKNAEMSIEIAEDWVMERSQEMYLSWEVKEGREVYVREMERKEKWECLEEERKNVVEELENGFFTNLVEEFILDLLC